MIEAMPYKTEILFTIILLSILILLNSLSKRAIRRFGRSSSIDMNSRKIIFYLSNLLFYLLAFIGISLIWGVNMKDFSVFISSVLAILGVGFVAQWSILSNLTASVILFFNHPLRLGDRIRVMDKDFDWTGKVEDISGFYLFMRTDDGKQITIPTNLVIQKGIEILHEDVAEPKQPVPEE
ncbi:MULTISPECIES: mechanosensitive ion channel family protein [unclassified Allomuricauda]|jgi:small-conductance mechanosensitive channel|uniref:mechanosensitive ion channel family protein n=1 Tax=Flavobacteriaceae TaxID=49546 RepID=UPI0015CDCD17|nr:MULTISPECIES: mechanosensitive ion channel domain-containing protein [unclassified Allomuricauda]MBO6588945.1 mechanosensitive ion channel [Allomuricauda sp.]MBO6618570.1 mechanosensitive ion channel [Allomuricauda sp.]MBO6644483.1 mechanosensitive ion channel [Allomuricauda sp.]MBO6746383.1 mechanosensitive ion channel [Allomuricauda sp.]MBO6830584.1 mechanosensitive ion channel [Allomuricauda sp.]